MKAVRALAELGAYTAGQWGLVTTAQARQVGVGTVTLVRLVDQGLLLRVRHGVYALAVAEETSHLEIKAAWLALRSAVPSWDRPKLDPGGGVVSHRTAALLHDLGDMVADKIEMIVPKRRTLGDAVRLRPRDLTDDDVTLADGLPVTTVERTVVDLLDDHVDSSHIAPVIHRAWHQDRLDLDRLVARVSPYSRRYGLPADGGRGLLDYLLEQVGDESPTEQALTEILLAYPDVNAEVGRALALPKTAERDRHGANKPVVPDLSEARMAPVRHAHRTASNAHRDQIVELLRRFRQLPTENQATALRALLGAARAAPR
ncbi:putative transcriptional regulator of viral defense system [Halopolyspora algeriensis]|uniref:Putative transcriptional regulator of viral defense system n=1 Tax=Halopolyspora algeriensis TaxID=1500506 RepID=A0A368VNM5_9ACTN|nr:type IV toxin-antitoxin system AbiEi family antitoxin domain-containing protein [Halopolyspora algeriensis]RCW43321.1 putative transcriptional regulator of viral defense system [Halopolyspora algeriensis]TQM56378.1 putative transcriptional regulator of viral defense system [Halopolyspora algeriensis]